MSFFVMRRRGMRPLRVNVYWIIFALAVIVAVGVRVILFSKIPGGVNQDEAMAAVDAKALAQYGTDRLGMSYPVHFQAWGFGQMSVLMSYLMVPFIKLFGFSTLVIRLPSLLVSLAGLVFLYLFCRDAFNRDFALIVLMFSAINPWHIVQSRWALDCNMFPHFLICAIYLLNHGLKKKKKLFLFLSMVVFGLSMYCYGISIYTVPLILVLASVVLLVQKKITPLDLLICVIIYIIIALPFIATIIINTFGLETITIGKMTIPYFPESIRSNDILFFSDNFFPQLWSNIKSLFCVLFQIGDDYLCNVVPGFSTLYICSIPFMLIGIRWMFRNWRAKSGTLLLMIVFVVSVFSGLITGNVNVNRINLIFYCLIILTCIGLYSVLKNVKYADIAMEVMYATLFTLFCTAYFTTYADAISLSFCEDLGKALSQADTTKYETLVVTPDVQAPGRWYVSEIYTLYFCDVDAKEYTSDSYSRRFKYLNPTDSYVDSHRNTQYVIKKEDSVHFADNEFNIMNFGRYSIATPVDKENAK